MKDLNQKEEELEKKAGVEFNNKSFLHKALVHRSYLNENTQEKESNERLEFLGDAVLEFVISEHLFQKFPTNDEGHLTALRSKLVNTTSLAETASELSLGEAIYLSKGEEQGGGRQNKALLANTLEALIGAAFLDGGVLAAREFISRFIIKKIPSIVKKSLKDPKSLLQEFVQARGINAPYYKVIREEGPAHLKKFSVEVLIDGKPYAKGLGASKKSATQEAASKALEKWKNLKV